MGATEIGLHGTELSGHCHRVELFIEALPRFKPMPPSPIPAGT